MSDAGVALCSSLWADAARLWLAVVVAMVIGAWMPSLSHAGSVPPVVWAGPTDAGGARGTLLVLHGGYWLLSGPGSFSHARPFADFARARGWWAGFVDFPAGRGSLDGAIAAYDALRRSEPEVPICIYGESSGGTLALLLAQRRPSVACVIAAAAPTDLPDTTDSDGSVRRLAIIALGRDALPDFSPATSHRLIHVPTLAGYASSDRVVPPHQGALLKRHGGPAVRVITLPSGSTDFVHSGTTRSAHRRWLRQTGHLLTTAKRSPHPTKPRPHVDDDPALADPPASVRPRQDPVRRSKQAAYRLRPARCPPKGHTPSRLTPRPLALRTRQASIC
jgi:acetyl esterase/lipase